MSNKQKLEIYELNENDMNLNYFHFTLENNLDNIIVDGLLPKIGKHATLIEKTPKVFFVKGLNNLLILFDCWINVWKKVPIVSFTYGIGSKLMKVKWFPKIFVDIYFKITKNSKLHKKNAYKIFDELLNKSVLLNLNLIERKDFDKNDIDEIKSSEYSKSHLITLGYSKEYSDIDNIVMDEWNMHTLSNIGVSADKIKLCSINGSIKMKDILLFALKKRNLNLEKVCPILYEYLKDRDFIF